MVTVAHVTKQTVDLTCQHSIYTENDHHLLAGARRAAKKRWSGWSARRSLSQASAACASDAAICRSRQPGVHAAAFTLYDAIANVGSHIAVTGAAAVGLGLPLLLPTPAANCVDREW